MAAPSKPYVVETDTERTTLRLSGLNPFVGFESNDSLIEGFTYDLKAWEATPIDESQEPFTVLPRVLPSPLVGVPEEYFQSGIDGNPERAADLELQDVVLESRNYFHPWVPKLWHGSYILNKEDYWLFCDESVVQIVDPDDNISGRNYLLLDKAPKSTAPIQARMYKRNDDWTVDTYRSVEQVEKFSGLAEAGGELETESASGEVVWANVETDIPEFKVSYETEPPGLIFNNDWTKLIGYEPSDYPELVDLENLGVCSAEDNQKFYTRYLPILSGNDELRVYLVDYVGETFVEWSRVDNFDSSGALDEHFIVDHDYGVITFGDGVNGAVPTSGHYVYITYRASLRVEYEEDSTTDLCSGYKANVSPLEQSLNHGFVTVSGYDDEPDTITLSSERSAVYIGTTISRLTAEVLSRAGRPVRDIDVYFEFVDGDDIGSIGGVRAPGDFITRTNHLGRAVTYYRPPTSVEDLTWYTSTISTSGQGLVLPAGASPDPFIDEHIYTYAIYRDDPLMGRAGASDGEVAWTTDPRPNGRKVLMCVETTSGSWKNPITGVPASVAAPVWRPLSPGSFNEIENSLEYTVTFVEPETGDTVVDTWIGGYAVIASRSVTIRAKCFSNKLGTWIYSNQVTIGVGLPDRMKGTYIEAGKSRIPFGWRLYDSDYDVASSITAGTYISINPRAGVYPIIDVIMDETWSGTTPSDTSAEAEYPFGRVHFVFTIT